VREVGEWRWTSFHKYREKGYYSEGWDEKNAEVFSIKGEFGE